MEPSSETGPTAPLSASAIFDSSALIVVSPTPRKHESGTELTFPRLIWSDFGAQKHGLMRIDWLNSIESTIQLNSTSPALCKTNLSNSLKSDKFCPKKLILSINVYFLGGKTVQNEPWQKRLHNFILVRQRSLYCCRSRDLYFRSFSSLAPDLHLAIRPPHRDLARVRRVHVLQTEGSVRGQRAVNDL